ncbi:MAG: branched-chain amino acid ABC transporter permease [Firmicutes bacterium]|nr:branched-chain amino acid ABC transporter permease [Bacillota bacterium]
MLRKWPLFLAVILILLFPYVLDSTYFRTIGIFIGIRAIVVIGLCLLMGYAGQASLGQAAFFALGAYTSGILTVHYGFPPWLALLAGIFLAALVAVAIGWPALKLRGHFLALATLSFGLIVYFLLKQWSDLTGGPSGLTGIPALSVAGMRLRAGEYYYLVWATVALVAWLSYNIVHSRIGRSLRAIHDSEVAAECLGMDTFRLKLQLFVLSAAYAALAGSLYAHFVRFFSPAAFGFKVSVEFAIMAALGGMASISGGLLGVATVTVLTEVLRAVVPQVLPAAHAVAAVEITTFGVILVVIFIFLPDGLAGGLKELRAKLRARASYAAWQSKGVKH